MTERTFCVVCAWRADCLKKFRYESYPTLNCADFTRDLTIDATTDEEDKGNDS